MLKTVLILLSLVVVTHSSSITYDSINRTTVTLVAGAPEGGYAEGPFDQALFWQPQGGSMIAGSGIAVVADTANQVIRGVDFASRRAFHIAGNPTVLGNCLDETCPLDSFVDGFGNASTLTMPYSVSLHPYQRHAFIADTRSRAIRKLDLHTGEVHTCMEGLGFPTDVVLWDDWLAFSDGLNHSIWVYRGVDLGSGVGDPPWAGGATLLSGANDWSAEGQYVEGSASSARFWEPLGLTYNPGEGKIYVADYRNRVIREVHPVTGFTARRVGRNDLPASSVSDGDDAMASVVLAGPTNLVYHGDADAVYFSDRNPEEDMGSIRVWYVGTGVVRTLVGQLTRRAGDGLVTSGLVGASAAWGVFLMPGGWVGWTETDTNSIRAVGPSGSTPCHVGEYHDMGLGSCTPCTNPVPHGVSYISSSSTYGVSGCPWRCPDPPYHMPFVCPISTSSVPGGALGVDAQGDRVVVCDPGLYKPYPNSTHCQLCSQGFYCTGLNEGLTGIQECPQNTTSYSGSTSCYCSPGWVGQSQDACTPCPMGYYCPGGNITLQCPGDLSSPPGSSSVNDCTTCTSYKPPNSVYLPPLPNATVGECPWECSSGYHNVSGSCTPCYTGPCSTGEYLTTCMHDQDSYCTPCTNRPAGVSSEYTGNSTVVGGDNCTWRCTDGYAGPSGATHMAQGAECTPCSDGPCDAGFYRFPCPAGSTQDLQCTPCSAGPLFSQLGLATPYNRDACEVSCIQGWHLLGANTTSFCCSDASNTVDGGESCTCSAGFRVGETGVDGADCVP